MTKPRIAWTLRCLLLGALGVLVWGVGAPAPLRADPPAQEQEGEEAEPEQEPEEKPVKKKKKKKKRQRSAWKRKSPISPGRATYGGPSTANH